MTQTKLAELETSSLAVTPEVLASTEYRGPPWNLSVLDEFELVYEDGVPMDNERHRLQMELLIDLVRQVMIARRRTDYFVSGNMFVYYTPEQARFVAKHKPRQYQPFCGPDFIFCDRVPRRERELWNVWEEDGHYPDIIAELLSPSTAHIDKGIKKKRYAEIFRTGEYYLYKPGSDTFTAYHLSGTQYKEATSNRRGFVRSPKLGMWLGLWKGVFRDLSGNWLRLYNSRGELIATTEEWAESEHARANAAAKKVSTERKRANAERKRANTESKRANAAEERADAAEERADAAEAELARLRAMLSQSDNS